MCYFSRVFWWANSYPPRGADVCFAYLTYARKGCPSGHTLFGASFHGAIAWWLLRNQAMSVCFVRSSYTRKGWTVVHTLRGTSFHEVNSLVSLVAPSYYSLRVICPLSRLVGQTSRNATFEPLPPKLGQ